MYEHISQKGGEHMRTAKIWSRIAVAASATAVLVPAIALALTDDQREKGFGLRDIPGQTGSLSGATGLGSQDIRATISAIIKVALSLLGVIALVIILAGGFKWMTAGGNEENVEGAKKLIFSGVIGLAIVLSAFAIAQFVIVQLSKATGSEGNQ